MKTYALVFFLALTTLARGQAIDSLGRQIRMAQHDTTRLRLYCDLADFFYKTNKYDSLYSVVQKALPLATRVGIGNYLGRLYHRKSLYYRSQGQFDNAIEQAQKALHTKQPQQRIGSILYVLAVIYSDKGDYKQAISQSMSNLAYGEKHREIPLILNSYGLLIYIYGRLKNDPLKMFYADQYLGLVKQSNDLEQQGIAFGLKADIYEERGNYALAWPYRQQALNVARKAKSKTALIAMLREAIVNLRKQGRLTEALRYVDEALQLGRQSEDVGFLGPIWNEMSLINLQLHQPQAALRAAREAVSVTRLGKRPGDLSLRLANLSTIQETTGHYQDALHTHKEYVSIRDSLTTVEKAGQIARIQTQYDVAKKESTILLLNKNAQLQREQFRVVNQQRLLFGLVVAVLLLIAISTGYFLRQTNQKNTVIQQRSLQLQQALQLRDKLFSILTHDLRSPVANLLFNLKLLQRNSPQTRGLTDLERQVNSVYATIDNLLYWALGQQSGLRARLVTINLTELVNEVLENFAGMLADKQLHVAVTYDQPENIVLADEKMTQISLRNIVHNAIKFSPVQGSITLTLAQQAGNVYLQIQDEGGGIKEPATVLSQTGSTKSDQGTGLGLVVSEELMRQNQGSLSIQSQVGEGTTVTLTFLSGS